MAKAAIEMGVWGLEATMLDMPLSRLIGGTRNEIDVGISLGIQKTPDELAKRVMTSLKAGYRKVKIKIMPGSDVEFIRVAREQNPIGKVESISATELLVANGLE